jgi:hypothetical protein
VARPCGICGGESGTGQVWKVEGSRSCSASSCCIGGVECSGFAAGLWFIDAFTKRKRTRNVEAGSVKHVNPLLGCK